MLQGYRRAVVALAALALAIVLIPASTDVEAQPAPVEITQLCRHLYTGQLRYAPQGCNPTSEVVFNTLENFPYTICASYYSGAMRIPTAAGCSFGELTLTIPDNLPLYFCINTYTGQLRYAYAPTSCPSGSFLGTINQPPPDLEDDAYDSLGNVGIEVAAVVDGLFTNDELEGGTLDTFQNPSANGGTVLVNADGTFEYTPPPGFEGDDTFTYTVTNAGGSDTATVTLTVAEVIWFIDDSAPGPGNGTLDNPFNTIANFNTLAADEPGDTIFVYDGFYGDPFAGLQDDQLLIGQAVDLLTVTGFVPPPFSRPLPGATFRPQISTGPGNVVPVADNNLVTGLRLDGATNGITALGGATGTTVDQMLITAMTGNGVIIQPSTDTTITNTEFGSNGTDINLNADTTVIQDVTSAAAGTSISIANIVNSLLIERVTTTDTMGTAMILDGAASGADIDVIDVALNDSQADGLHVLNSAAGSDFNFDNFCICSVSTLLTSGGGATFDTNAGAFDFDAASTIENKTNHAFFAANNAMTLAYNGDITENSIEFMRVVNDTSTLTFQNGTLQATGSDRVYFENAGGTYDFLGTTTLTGMLDGVVILNSDGGFTFGPDASILLAVLDYGLRVEGGAADVDYSGTINISSAGGSAVSVAGGHTGTLTFQPASLVAASAGDGLQFDDADGVYDFQGAVQLVNLAAEDPGVDILGNSNGTFTFSADAVINSPTGDAFHVTGDGTNSPSITYSGTIVNDANEVIEISNTVGPNTITFDSAAVGAISDTGTGIFLNGVAQNVSFTAQISLMGDEGVDIDGGSGTFTFTDTDIVDTTIVAALSIDGGATVSNFLTASSIGQAQSQSAVSVTNGHTGTLTYDGTINATNGDGLQFNDADGTYSFNVSGGTTTLAGGDAGIDLVNFTDGLFIFTNPTITNPALGPAINIEQGIAETTFDGLDVDTNGTPGLVANSTDFIAVNNATNPATIDSLGAPAIDLSATDQLAMTFTSVSSANSFAEGIDIDGIVDTGSIFTIDDGNAGTSNDATISTTAAGFSGIDIDSSAGTFTFAGVDIDNAGDDGVNLESSFAATVNVQSGTIDATVAEGIHSVATGTLNIGTAAPSGVVFGSTTPIGASAILINSTGAAPQNATVLNNSSPVTTSITGVGIVLSAAGPGTLAATLDGNDIKATDHALQTVDGGTANALHVAVNANTWESGTGVDTMELVGAAPGSTVVTSLSSGGTGNTVVANGTNGGVLFDQITFDADTGTASIQQVAGGATNVGQGTGAAQRVQGDGIVFDAPTGDLAFGTLNIFNDSGTGLEVDTKTLGTTFTIGSTGGTVDAAGGPAMFLDPLTADLTFGTVTSTNSTTGAGISNGTGLTLDQVAGTLDITTLTISNAAGDGLFVNGSTGTFTITDGSITGAGAAAVRVDNGGAADTSTLTYDGSITNTANRSVLIEDKSGGAVNLGGTLNDSGTGVLVQNNGGGTVVDFDGTTKTLNTGANQAVTLTNNDGATVNFSNGGLDIDTSGAANGFNATGGGTVNVTGASNTVNTSTGTGVAINIDGTDIGTDNVTFQSVTVDGAPNGIVLNGTGTLGGLTITGDGSVSPTQGGNGSGGTIQNTTGPAILLTSTNDFSATQLNVLSPNTGNEALLATDLSGAGNVLNSGTISGWRSNGGTTDAVRIINTGTTVMTLTVANSVFENGGSTLDGNDNGNDAIVLFAQGTSNNTLNIQDSSFTEIFGDAVDAIAGDNSSSGDVNLTVMGSSFTNAAADGNGGIQARTSTSGDLTATIGGPSPADGNTFNDTHRLGSTAGVIELQGNGSGTLTAIVENNDLDNFNQSGINIVADDSSNVFARVQNNAIDPNNDDRIGIRGSIRNTGETDIALIGNQIGQTVALAGSTSTRSPIDMEIFDDAGAGAAENVQILMSGNVATQNSSSANSETVDLFVDNNAQVDLTVINNSFTNQGAGIEFFAELLGSELNLNLGNGGANTADGGAGTFLLLRTAGTFNVQDLANVNTDNNGTVTTSGVINDIVGPVPLPDATP